MGTTKEDIAGISEIRKGARKSRRVVPEGKVTRVSHITAESNLAERTKILSVQFTHGVDILMHVELVRKVAIR